MMKLPERIKNILLQPNTLLVVYIIAALFGAIQLYSLGAHPWTYPKDPFPVDIMNQEKYVSLFPGKLLTEYNNYRIFKYSYFHLLAGNTTGSNEVGLYGLYGIYPNEHWDFFKYSPTFALLMGSLAYLPDIVGLCIWNILNALAVFFAIRMLPFKQKAQCFMLWFIAQEMLTCLQNTQSNGLMCGLMVAAYACMQQRKTLLATLWIVLAMYIKVYGAIAFCLFLFYPDKMKFILYSAMWTVLFAVLPLVVTPLHTLIWQYQNWAYLLKADAQAAVGLSVAGWLKTWFGLENTKTAVSVIGIVLFLLPLARINMYKDQAYRMMVVASMLIWVIIFNHKAESSTFIIAVTGVAIWYFAQPKAMWRTVLLIFVFVFTCLSYTDIFPHVVKRGLIYPYTIKAVPCILAWCVVFVELMTSRPGKEIRGGLEQPYVA